MTKTLILGANTYASPTHRQPFEEPVRAASDGTCLERSQVSQTISVRNPHKVLDTVSPRQYDRKYV